MLFATLCYAQGEDIRYTLLQSSAEGVTVKVDFPSYETIPVDVNGTTMYRLKMQHGYPLLEAGAPELLQTAISLIVPENSQPTAKIIDAQYTIVNNFELAPSKGKLYRNINPATVAYTKGDVYAENRMLLDDQVNLGEIYQLHDYQGVAVHLFPFAYNPAQKELKTYTSLTFKVDFNSNGSFKRLSSVTKTFNDIYADHFLNYATAKSTPLEEDGDILIIAPQAFLDVMKPYADWKIKNGYNTEIVSLSEVGNTSSAVRTYIANYYNSHDLVYVLLVGDNNQFPTISVGGNVSDNYYGEIVGNDKYPDVIIGKISAETPDQAALQVSKFIQYEQAPAETSHFPVFCGIGSSEGPGDNSEYDYAHIRNIGNKLQAYTYTSGYEIFDGSRGGLDANGDATAAQVTAAVNAGTGIINYTGHGDYDLWYTSYFLNTNVNNLSNYDKLPFIISVACLNGDYSGQTCFAEAWLRASKNGRPTGAVGTLMATISQPWNSPMCAQDRMIEILTGTSAVAQKRTFGGIAFNGIIKMLDTYNDYEVARTWILFGDPAMMVRTAIPQQLAVDHETELRVGVTSTSFTSTTENAKIVLTKDGSIVAKGYIANGSCTLNLPNDLEPTDTLHLLACAPNYLPIEADIIIIPNAGPYVVCQNLTLHDNRNNDGLADYGETLTIDATLKNVGIENAHNTRIVLTTDDPYLTVSNGVLVVNDLNADNSNTYNTAFIVKVSNNAPAFHNAVVNFQITTEGEEAHTSTKSILLHAPLFKCSEIAVDDATQGNGNQQIDLHETALLKVVVTNDGNSASAAGTAYISNPDGNLVLYRYPQEIPALAVGESHTLQFRAAARANEPTTAQIHTVFVTTNGFSYTQDINVKVGFVMEDWESGDFTAFNWNNTSSSPWTITTQTPYEGTYAARSGSIGNSSNSSIYVSYTNTADDTLSFYYKVSSEEGYDFLKFFIDNSVVEKWSGNIGWTKYSVNVPAGTHTYKWQYIKDSYMSSGSDMAMIDNISFPCMSKTTGIEDFFTDDVVVYPNPTTDNVQILLPEMENLNDIQLQLFDLSGRLLQQETVTSTSTTLSLSNFAQGIYILKLTDKHNILKTIKIVKQ